MPLKSNYAQTQDHIRAKFVISVANLEQFPTPDKPEFAFIGRSNVGKSSLINLLCNNQNLALTSKTPGKTKLINYFLVEQSWYLVDLPGYGYAKVSKTEREVWLNRTAEYLATRSNLVLTFVLIDGSLPPQGNDLDFLAWVNQTKLNHTLIFTKVDKVSQKELNQNIKLLEDELKQRNIQLPKYFISTKQKPQSKKPILDFIYEQIQAVSITKSN